METMLVLVVIGILIAIAMPSISGMMDQGNIMKAKGDLKTIKTALESYYMHASPKSYPPKTNKICGSVLSHAFPDIIDTQLYDPFGKTLTSEYTYTASDDGQYYAVYSLGPNGTSATGTPASNGNVVSGGDDIVVTNGQIIAGGVEGSGGSACSGSQTNCAGSCVDTASDNLNCGGCAIVCGEGKTCTSGTCGVVTPPGSIAIGQACAIDADCASSGVCGGLPKVCRETGSAANGQWCSQGSDCRSGYCGESLQLTSICTNGALGDACGNTSACQSGICADGHCTDLQIGNSCGWETDTGCKSGLFCVNWICSNVKGALTAICRSAEDCQSGYCSNSIGGVCTNGELGAPCNCAYSGQTQCASHYCGYSSGAGGPQVCTSGATGNGCQFGFACQNNICVNFVCSDQKGAAGAICGGNFSCLSGKCVDMTCVP